MELRPMILRLEKYSPVARQQFRVALNNMKDTWSSEAPCNDCYEINSNPEIDRYGYCEPCSDMVNFFNQVNKELSRLE